MPKKKAVEEIYQKKSPREHVLLRPDTYVGSVERDIQTVFVLDHETVLMKEQEIEFVPALYKIFDEILVNAADNKQRDPTMKSIKVAIDVARGFITVKNDGKGIPIEIHKEHGMYVPELIFGNLLTSSNYNDGDKKTVGGRNGFGAKLANIFSTKFIVETVDSSQKQKYKQKWRNNMGSRDDPVIESCGIKDYTKITFYPDFKRFKMESFEDGIIKLFIKRVYDIAGTTAKDLKVHLDIKCATDEEQEKYLNIIGPIKINSFVDYAKLFIGKNVKLKQDYFYFQSEENNNSDDKPKWEVIMALNTDDEYRQMSHVNNIWTIKGGSHIKYIENQFVKYFKTNFKSKLKKVKEMLKPKMIKDNLFIFINCLIVNPAFSSQTKEILTTKSPNFGSKCLIPDDTAKRLMNKLKDIIKELINFKIEQGSKKTDGRKSRRLQLPPEIDDANDAGGKYSSECILIVTEGLSAKTLAVAGISELPGSKNRFGIFPLKGKLLNVRDASTAAINKNNEITNLKKILGLKHKEKYDTDKKLKTLRYGKVMIMTDQDYDGSHIKGLMINFFHSLWPEIIQNHKFIQQFITPIVVAKKAKNTIMFYTIPQYDKWKLDHNNGKGWKVKYYKGLGTWDRKAGKEHFRNLKKHQIEFNYNGPANNNNSLFNNNNNNNNNSSSVMDDDMSIIKAFSKDKSDLRKEWISNYEPGTFLDFTQNSISYRDFIDKELILFSVSDLGRSIPSIFDGLKPGQRKILYCCFLKGKFTKEIRVAQLGGYVSEKSSYHHGETSLYQTIIGMSQDYVGSNNINLLSPNGMFGSRMKGGKDAASPRYIHTNLAGVTRIIYKNEDDLILEYQDDDGYPVEPVHYLPIIPMVLINGAEGIGTGWSTFIPNYNPKDIIRNIRRKLSGQQIWEVMDPYYRGYTGKLIKTNNNQPTIDNNQLVESSTYRTQGICEIIDTQINNETNLTVSTLQVTELPIRCWTENYKKFLMDLEATEQIDSVNNMSSDIDISFTFNVTHKIKPKAGSKGKARGRAKTKKGEAAASTNSTSGSVSPSRAAKEKKIKKKIYFNGVLDEEFLKSMKLSSSMGCTNMVLFDTNGKIKKYQSVEAILDEFYEARLIFYGKRKKAQIKNMKHSLLKMQNQTRFIMMIIENKLILSRKKKDHLIKELYNLQFDTWNESQGSSKDVLKNRARATMEDEDDDDDEKGKTLSSDEDDDDDDDDEPMSSINNNRPRINLKEIGAGYKYLLSMPLSSLTLEKVNKLLKQQEQAEGTLEILQKKSVKDLWRADLDALEDYLNIYDQEYADNLVEMRKETEKSRNAEATKGGKGKGKGKGKARKKRVTKPRVKKIKGESTSTTNSSSSKSTKTSTKESSVASSTTKSIQKTLDKFAISKPKKEKVTKKKRIKKKLLSTSNSIKDPFSLAKSNKKMNIDSDNDESYDFQPKLSFSERIKLRQKNSPNKQSNINPRKRKRNSDDDDDDLFEVEESESNEINMNNEPPKKKYKSKSKSKSSDSSSSNSSSVLPLRAKSKNKTLKKKKKNKFIVDSDDDDEDDFNDDDDDDDEQSESVQYKPKKRSKKAVESDEDFDIDVDDVDLLSNSESNSGYKENNNNNGGSRKVLRKRNTNKKSYKDSPSPESENMDDSDLEINEEDSEGSDSEYVPQ